CGLLKDQIASLTPTVSSTLERIAHAIAVQADSTRTAVIHEGEHIQNVAVRQAEMTRAAIGEQSELTRSTLINVIQQHLDALGLDSWRLKELEGLLRYQRRRDYLAAIESGTLEVPHLE